MSSIFYTGELNGKSKDQNDKEKRIVEEIAENIDLAWFELSGIDLIEDLQENESVEKDTVVLSRLIIPLLNSDRGRNTE